MDRSVISIKLPQQKKLAKMAKRDKMTVEEITSRAIDLYFEIPPGSLETLDLLADELIKSSRRTLKELTKSEKKFNKALANLNNGKGKKQ